MDFKTLEKMTVVKLREEAHKFDDIKGAVGMSKEQLIDILCEKHGIDRSHHVRKGIGRRALKGKIKELRGQRQEVLKGDRGAIKRYRRRIKSLRRRLTKVIAHAEKMEARKAGEAPKPPAGEEAPAQ